MPGPKNYGQLRRRLLTIIVSFSMIPLLGMSYIFFYEFNQTYKEKTARNIHTIVSNKQKSIDLFLKEKIAFIRTLAYANTFSNISTPAAIQNLFSSLKSGASDFIDLGVIDQHGQHVAYMGPYEISSANYKNEQWFQEVLIKGVYVSDVSLGFRNYPHFIIAVLRREQDQTWILRATVDLDVLKSMVQSVQTGRHGDAYLANAQGKLQTPARFPYPSIPSFNQLPPAGEVALEWKEKHNQGPLLTGMVRLKTVNWLLVVDEDWQEQMGPMLRADKLAVIALFGGLFIIVGGAFLVTGDIIKKIRRADQEAANLDASVLQSNKMAALGKMAAGVAHEVNNPLTMIRESAGWAKDLLEEEDAESIHNYQELHETLTKIDQHVERAKAVTHRMLGFGRRMDPRQENVNLNSILLETVKFMENEAMFRNISIVNELDTQLPFITIDPIQAQQVFLNILDNAIDAIGQNGTITLTSGKKKEGQEIFIAIGDTGEGMDKEKLQHIFDPFYTTKEVGEGTGLGLAIVFGLLEKMNGRIFAESEPEKGTTFTITFPLEQ